MIKMRVYICTHLCSQIELSNCINTCFIWVFSQSLSWI